MDRRHHQRARHGAAGQSERHRDHQVGRDQYRLVCRLDAQHQGLRYLSGNYSFSGNGASAGVINNGRINVSDGGFAALLGGQVTNNGVIAARLGIVALGAGEQATLDLSGDGFLSVAVPSSELGNLVNANGALVSNKGKILANGGTVFLSAATASNILRNAVNIRRLDPRQSVGTHNGRIVINGGGGTRQGHRPARCQWRQEAQGGSIAVSGAAVNVSGKLSANGTAGGTVSAIGDGRCRARWRAHGAMARRRKAVRSTSPAPMSRSRARR